MSRYKDRIGDLCQQVGGPSDALAAAAGIMASSAEAPSELELLNLARWHLRARVRRQRFFPRALFRESAWDMLLDLFVARHENRAVCVKQLIAISGETPTSAMRKIDRLGTLQLISRETDPADRRRQTVTLTPRGLAAMIAYLRDGIGAPSAAGT